MKTTLNIVIIGTGNVALSISSSFKNLSTIQVIQVFNHRKSKQAKLFSQQLNCDLVTEYSMIDTQADIYIIAVKDDAIVEVVNQLMTLRLKGIVVHTAGSVDMSILKTASENIGVYYPLQSFYNGAIIDWQTTPILIEGNNKHSKNTLTYLAKSVSEKVSFVNSKARIQIHLAAVFACNFTNAMYVSAYQIMETHLGKKSVDLLQPLMLQSFQKLQKVHPKMAQTGPAMRNDQLVMKKHISALKQNKSLEKVYKTISNLIQEQQNTQ